MTKGDAKLKHLNLSSGNTFCAFHNKPNNEHTPAPKPKYHWRRNEDITYNLCQQNLLKKIFGADNEDNTKYKITKLCPVTNTL